VDLAREAKKKGGVSLSEAEILKQWAKETDLPARGPESHPKRLVGKKPHLHVGPVDHIPVK